MNLDDEFSAMDSVLYDEFGENVIYDDAHLVRAIIDKGITIESEVGVYAIVDAITFADENFPAKAKGVIETQSGKKYTLNRVLDRKSNRDRWEIV